MQSAAPGPKHVSHLGLQVRIPMVRSLIPQKATAGFVSAIELVNLRVRLGLLWEMTIS